MESRINVEQNEAINTTIDDIYSRLPSNRRLLPMADRKFFAKDANWRKRRRLREKIKWSRQAKVVIDAYEQIAINSGEARLLREYFLDNG
jgi:hypothetical protein